MFIPIGDDVQKRNLPLVGIVLIIINMMVYGYQARLWEQTVKDINPYTFDPRTFDFTKTPSVKFMCQWGVVPADMARGKTIGLFTYMFLHGDLFHVLGNMIMLWAFVGTLENALGAGKFLFFYLLWGIVAGAAHAAFSWGDKLPMIGASGAVAGMIGAYFVVFGALSKIKTLIFLPRPIKVTFPAGLYVVIWIFFQLAGLEAEAKHGQKHVAYYALLGGAAIGALTMALFRRSIHSRLELNAEGALQFKDELHPTKTSALVTAGVASTIQAVPAPPPPSRCPYCRTTLEEAHKVADRLWRCPNESCQRLIY